MMLVSFLVLFGLTVLVNKHEASSAVNETTSAEAPLDESLWESSVEFYEKVNNYFALTTTFVVILGGFVGNFFTFLTVKMMNKMKSFETSSISVYLTSLAIADFSSALWDGLINITLPHYTDFKISVQSEWLCKVSRWHDWSSTRAAVFILVSFTLDRCLAVTFPIAYRNKFGSRGFAAKIVLGCFLTAYIIGIPRLVLSSLITPTKCKYMEKYSDTVLVEKVYGQWFGYYLSLAFFPALVIVLCNVIVIYKIRSRENKQSSNSKGNAVVQMLVSASVLFIIFTLGASVAEEMRNHLPEGWSDDAIDTRDDFLDNINELLNTCNNSFNFFIYVLTSERFRSAFLKLFDKLLGKDSGNPGNSLAANTALSQTSPNVDVEKK